jgi:hypothetical protein
MFSAAMLNTGYGMQDNKIFFQLTQG